MLNVPLSQVCMMVDDVILYFKDPAPADLVFFSPDNITLRSVFFAMTVYVTLLLTNFISTFIIFHKTWFVFHLIQLGEMKD